MQHKLDEQPDAYVFLKRGFERMLSKPGVSDEDVRIYRRK
jgi:hypothetical protein